MFFLVKILDFNKNYLNKFKKYMEYTLFLKYY